MVNFNNDEMKVAIYARTDKMMPLSKRTVDNLIGAIDFAMSRNEDCDIVSAHCRHFLSPEDGAILRKFVESKGGKFTQLPNSPNSLVIKTKLGHEVSVVLIGGMGEMFRAPSRSSKAAVPAPKPKPKTKKPAPRQLESPHPLDVSSEESTPVKKVTKLKPAFRPKPVYESGSDAFSSPDLGVAALPPAVKKSKPMTKKPAFSAKAANTRLWPSTQPPRTKSFDASDSESSCEYAYGSNMTQELYGKAKKDGKDGKDEMDD